MDEAVRLAGTEARNSVVAAACLSELGFVLGYRGKVADAVSAFNQASALKAPHNYSFELASMWEVKHADFLTKIGNVDQARAIAKATLKTSNRRSWKQDFAACHVILGRLDLQQQQFGTAREHFDIAESIFRRGHMLTDLADLLLAQARLHLQLENLEEAERHLEESVRISSPRELVLVRVDGLNLRAQVLLRKHRARRSNAATADVDAALDAADSSLSITRSCGYLWAERDAHALLREIWTELKNPVKATEHSHANQQLSASLTIKKNRKGR
ncbi:MAG: hypothetical protein AUI36_02890 [Cyanobacteria bacterium 13_1_40CM_2_61_4]|nr:MAG: hypothetical protein AUI36_02890 [Cyanobacteria bacterium 13_1_40CM_2_61_4]